MIVIYSNFIFNISLAKYTILLDPEQFLVVRDHDDDGGVRGHAAGDGAGQVRGLAVRHLRGPGHVHPDTHHCQQLPGLLRHTAVRDSSQEEEDSDSGGKES